MNPDSRRVPFWLGYATRAMEVAVAGGHSVFLCGPSGIGKSLLASLFTDSSLDWPTGPPHVVEFRSRVPDCSSYTPPIIVTGWPCPCGSLGSRILQCTCPLEWRKKFSLMLWSRVRPFVQMRVRVALDGAITSFRESEPMENVFKRVSKAWEIQKERQGTLNARMPLHHWMPKINERTKEFLLAASKSYNWLPREVESVIQIAQTIADLEQSEINGAHLYEAAQYIWHTIMDAE